MNRFDALTCGQAVLVSIVFVHLNAATVHQLGIGADEKPLMLPRCVGFDASFVGDGTNPHGLHGHAMAGG